MEDILAGTKDFTPDSRTSNGTAPAPPQVEQKMFEQTLLRINGHLSLPLPEYMTLSGNACKLYAYLSSAEGVVILFQQGKFPFGVGLQDLRTVIRVLKELWRHKCIKVHFDQIAVDDPLGLFVKGRNVVLKTESEFITINRIYVRCVGFPEQIPPLVAKALDERLKRQIAYHEERLWELQREKDQWEQRMRRQQKHGDTTSHEAGNGNGQGSDSSLPDG